MTDLYIPDPVILDLEEIPMAIAQYSGLIGQLASRLMIERRNPQQEEEDVLLTVAEAAAMLSCTEKWLYGRAKTLPFVKHINARALRFSKKGIIAWIAKRH